MQIGEIFGRSNYSWYRKEKKKRLKRHEQSGKGRRNFSGLLVIRGSTRDRSNSSNHRPTSTFAFVTVRPVLCPRLIRAESSLASPQYTETHNFCSTALSKTRRNVITWRKEKERQERERREWMVEERRRERERNGEEGRGRGTNDRNGRNGGQRTALIYLYSRCYWEGEGRIHFDYRMT